jgi:TRAP-type uncharacterized transport system substrate-binding protein
MTSQSDTLAFAMSQGVAKVINDKSDKYEVESRPSGGAAESLKRMDQGEVDISYGPIISLNKILEEKGEYAENPFDNGINQLWLFYDVFYNWVTSKKFKNEGIESVTDLRGQPVSPKGAGTSSRDILFGHLSYVFDDPKEALGKKLSLSGSEDPQALKSGRVKAVNDLRLNIDVHPGYLDTMYSTLDVWSLRWPRDVVEKIKEDPLLSGQILGPDELSDPVPDFGDRDGEWHCQAKFMSVAKPSMSEETAYDLMSIIWNNMEELKEYHALISYWSDPEFFTNASEVVPVHPGAEKLYDEIG